MPHHRRRSEGGHGRHGVPERHRRRARGRGVAGDLRRHRPDHRRGLRDGPDVGRRGRRPRVRRRRRGLRGLGLRDRPRTARTRLLKIAGAIEERIEEINAVECKDTGKPLGLTMSEEMPYASDHFKFFAGAARLLEGRSAGRVPGRPHLVGPARADRRRRAGDAVELPADDDDLEDRPGARGRQHRGAQAERHHARELDAAGRARAGVPAARRAQRRVRRPRHRPRAGRAQDPADGGDHRLGRARACRSPSRPRRDLKRVHLELGGKAPVVVFDDADVAAAAEGIAGAGLFNAGQDCTAATRVLVQQGIHDEFVAALAEAAQGMPTGMPDDEATYYGPPQQRQPARPRLRHGRPAARPRDRADRRHPARRQGLLLRAHRRVRPPAEGRADPGPRSSARS